ncbi:hypothetical protein HK096_006199 [Nowakowskiella sp. JEL0078]|nr:hypothetical protein HK096_006199 [Nowakowskiella sp. JEL0078]
MQSNPEFGLICSESLYSTSIAASIPSEILYIIFKFALDTDDFHCNSYKDEDFAPEQTSLLFPCWTNTGHWNYDRLLTIRKNDYRRRHIRLMFNCLTVCRKWYEATVRELWKYPIDAFLNVNSEIMLKPALSLNKFNQDNKSTQISYQFPNVYESVRTLDFGSLLITPIYTAQSVQKRNMEEPYEYSNISSILASPTNILKLFNLCSNLYSLQIRGSWSSLQINQEIYMELITTIISTDLPSLRKLTLLYIPVHDLSILRGLQLRSHRPLPLKHLTLPCVGSRSPPSTDLDSMLQLLEYRHDHHDIHDNDETNERHRVSPDVLRCLLAHTPHLESLYVSIKDNPNRVLSVISEASVATNLVDFGLAVQWASVIEPAAFVGVVAKMPALQSLTVPWSAFVRSSRQRLFSMLVRKGGVSLKSLALYVTDQATLGLLMDGFLDLGRNLTSLRLPGSVMQRNDLLLVAYSCPELVLLDAPDFAAVDFVASQDAATNGDILEDQVSTTPFLSLWIDVLDALPKLRFLDICGVPMQMDAVLTYISLMRVNEGRSNGFKQFSFSVLLSQDHFTQPNTSHLVWNFASGVSKVRTSRTTGIILNISESNQEVWDLLFNEQDLLQFAMKMKTSTPDHVEAFLELYQDMHKEMVQSRKLIMEFMVAAKDIDKLA